MSQHIRFWIHFVHVAFTSTKDKASPYIFKRIFVSMPIHLLVSFLLFIMSNLFYRGGAGSYLSILKEAKKNYMGWFIFSRGWGSLFVAFPWVETSTGPGGFKICVFII